MSMVENYSIALDPRMPGMANHSSPNNEDLTYDGNAHMYTGKLSLTVGFGCTEVHGKYLFIRKTYIITGSPSFTTSNKTFYLSYLFNINFTGLFVFDKLSGLFVDLNRFFVVQSERTVVVDHKIGKSQGFVLKRLNGMKK